MIDVDASRRIGDLYPDFGRVLASVGRRLRQAARPSGWAATSSLCSSRRNRRRGALDPPRQIARPHRLIELADVGSVTASAGVAGFPHQAFDRDELIRLADSARYWAKGAGRTACMSIRPDVVELAGSTLRLAHEPDRAARFRAAASLREAVDARDTYTGSHSTRVAELSAWIAHRLGLDREHIELTRLAGASTISASWRFRRRSCGSQAL